MLASHILRTIDPHPLLAYGYGYGGGWGWWWWWIALIIFFWLIFLPPWGYGRRWYAGRGTTAVGSYSGEDSGMRWQAVEAHFVDSPTAAVAEADAIVARLLRGRKDDALNADYRAAHDTLQQAGSGADTDSLRRTMLAYRSIFERVRQSGRV